MSFAELPQGRELIDFSRLKFGNESGVLYF